MFSILGEYDLVGQYSFMALVYYNLRAIKNPAQLALAGFF